MRDFFGRRMQRDRSHDDEERGDARHLEAELDERLQRNRRQAGGGADSDPVERRIR